MKLLITIPARVANQKHVEMIRVQTLLVPRLRQCLPSVELVSALLVDWCAEGHRNEIDKLGRSFDLYRHGVPVQHRFADWGIRPQTHHAIALCKEQRATHLMRVGQDTFVDQVSPGISDWIPSAMAEPGEWIAANVHHWRGVSGYGGYMAAMGLAFDGNLDYANGALIMAPATTWTKHYLPMPPEIVHWWDDVVFSESVRQRGGRLIDWPPYWRHVHDCCEKTSRKAHANYGRQLTGGGQDVSRFSETTTLRASEGLCTMF